MSVHFTELPRVGDEVTGVVTGVVGAVTVADEDGNPVTRVRFEVELQEEVDSALVVPQEPAGGVEPHAGQPEPKVTSSENPNREADLAAEKKASAARAAQKVANAQKTADQREVNAAGDQAAKGVKSDAKTSSDKK